MAIDGPIYIIFFLYVYNYDNANVKNSPADVSRSAIIILNLVSQLGTKEHDRVQVLLKFLANVVWIL